MLRQKRFRKLTFAVFPLISHAVDMTEPIALRARDLGVAPTAISRPEAELCHAQPQALSDQGAKG